MHKKTKLNFMQNAQNAENERKPEAAAGADRGIGPLRNRRKGEKMGTLKAEHTGNARVRFLEHTRA
nr:MAG TPA: hypothetical protein [Caudoviricetes sp.]